MGGTFKPPTIRKGKLVIVDLAGSERIHKSGLGGHSYLMQPMWWAGIVTTYSLALAPAILITPLGAQSIIISKLLQPSVSPLSFGREVAYFGVVGCLLCLVGSTTIVLQSPHETQVSSVRQVWHFATKPGQTLENSHAMPQADKKKTSSQGSSVRIRPYGCICWSSSRIPPQNKSD